MTPKPKKRAQRWWAVVGPDGTMALVRDWKPRTVLPWRVVEVRVTRVRRKR